LKIIIIIIIIIIIKVIDWNTLWHSVDKKFLIGLENANFKAHNREGKAMENN
jgi:hypothetical protein